MPISDALTETGIHHVSMKIVSRRSLARKDIPAQQRRNDMDMRFFVILHLAERKRQLLLCTQAGKPGEKAKQPQVETAFAGKLKIPMQEEVLMADADLRYGRTEKQVSQSRKQFIEVNDQLGTTFFYAMVYIVHALDVSRQFYCIICHTARKTDSLIGRCRQKIWTQEAFHRSLDAAVKETGQTA